MSAVPLTDTTGPTAAPPGPCACPRHAAMGPLLGVAGWLAAAVGALYVAEVPFDAGEALCGMWGCFPPLPALASMHLFWGVAFGAGVWAVARWRPVLLRPAGVVLVAGAVAAGAVLIERDLPRWFDSIPDEYHHYWPRRVAYAFAVTTDVPLLQAAAAGVVCFALGARRRARASDPAAADAPAADGDPGPGRV